MLIVPCCALAPFTSVCCSVCLCYGVLIAKGVYVPSLCLTLSHSSVMDKWQSDLRARVMTGCVEWSSSDVVWRGALQLQEQLEASTICTYVHNGIRHSSLLICNICKYQAHTWGGGGGALGLY